MASPRRTIKGSVIFVVLSLVVLSKVRVKEACILESCAAGDGAQVHPLVKSHVRQALLPSLTGRVHFQVLLAPGSHVSFGQRGWPFVVPASFI